jgi:hypothetical protein
MADIGLAITALSQGDINIPALYYGGVSDKPHNVMAMIMLDRPATVDVAQLVAKVGPALDIRDDSPPPPPGTSFVLPASGDVIMGMIIPAPMPVDAYQDAAETAFWWPEALQVAAQHQCHLIAACAWSGDTRLDAHIKHTVLIRGLLDQVPATAVLWGSVLVSVDQFKGLFQALQTEKTVPVQLWVKIQLSLDGRGGTIASTLGMGDFGLMEIECNPAPMPPDETAQFVENLAGYLIANGPVVADGHTIGKDTSERITVRHAKSFRDDLGLVYLIDFSLPGEPKTSMVTSMLGRMFGRRN